MKKEACVPESDRQHSKKTELGVEMTLRARQSFFEDLKEVQSGSMLFKMEEY